MNKKKKSEKRKKARELHSIAKRRARCKRVMEPFRGDLYWADYSEEVFHQMIAELSKLNVKYLQQLLSDLKKNNPNSPFNPIRAQHNRLISSLEHLILERTILNG